MQFTTMKVSYTMRLSQNFQSAEVSAQMEVIRDKGESPEVLFAEAMKRLIPLVETEAHTAVKQAAYLASTDL